MVLILFLPDFGKNCVHRWLQDNQLFDKILAMTKDHIRLLIPFLMLFLGTLVRYPWNMYVLCMYQEYEVNESRMFGKRKKDREREENGVNGRGRERRRERDEGLITRDKLICLQMVFKVSLMNFFVPLLLRKEVPLSRLFSYSLSLSLNFSISCITIVRYEMMNERSWHSREREKKER